MRICVLLLPGEMCRGGRSGVAAAGAPAAGAGSGLAGGAGRARELVKLGVAAAGGSLDTVAALS